MPARIRRTTVLGVILLELAAACARGDRFGGAASAGVSQGRSWPDARAVQDPDGFFFFVRTLGASHKVVEVLISDTAPDSAQATPVAVRLIFRCRSGGTVRSEANRGLVLLRQTPEGEFRQGTGRQPLLAQDPIDDYLKARQANAALTVRDFLRQSSTWSPLYVFFTAPLVPLPPSESGRHQAPGSQGPAATQPGATSRPASGAQAETSVAGRESSLHAAIRMRRPTRLKELLMQGGDPNERDALGETLLHYAVRCNCPAMLHILAHTAGVNLNVLDNINETPLHKAVRLNRQQCARELIAAGACLDIKDAKAETPRQMAQRLNRQAILRLLQAAGKP